MSNPLLHIEGLPPFSQIKPEHIQPAIQELIEENRQAIEQVLKQPHFTWENFIEPLSEAGEHLSRAWSPISHLNSVKNSPELRDAYQACLPLLSEYSTWVGQHKGLYNAYLALKNSPEFATYSVAQKKAIENALRDFELSGIGLSEEKQKRYGEIVARLSELSAQFKVLFSQRQKVVLTLAIRNAMPVYFVQLRIAKVKTTFCLCENSTLNCALNSDKRATISP